MKRVEAVEGVPLDVDFATALAVRRRLVDLQRELRPRVGFLSGSDTVPVVQNLVGSVQVASELVLDIVPKTRPGEDWATAVLDLLVDERIHFAGETDAAELAPRQVMADVFARIFAEQLDIAVRREGPLSMLVRRDASRQRLVGRLDVTRWVVVAATRPTAFPQAHTVLTVDNDFTSAMAWVAQAFALRCVDKHLAARLRNIAERLRPGLPHVTGLDPSVALRPIPAQWRAYGPAWATTCAVLKRMSPLHHGGLLKGFSLAVEPWPLLERLLVRALHAAARLAELDGLRLRAVGHSAHTLLTADPVDLPSPPLARLSRPRAVEPDGSLWVGDEVVATFEAKYSLAGSDSAFRGHVFQAMTTAAAMGAPLAVLIYPERSGVVTWTVRGFAGKPLKLAAVGLDIFGYRRGAGDDLRGALVLRILREGLPAMGFLEQTAH